MKVRQLKLHQTTKLYGTNVSNSQERLLPLSSEADLLVNNLLHVWHNPQSIPP